MRRGFLAAAAVLPLLASCATDATAPEAGREPGALVIAGWTGNLPTLAGTGGSVLWGPQREATDVSAADVLVVPDTVNEGQAFEVRTWTVGPSGCWRADGQTVGMIARVVILRPYDAHSGAEACTGALVFLSHASTLVLKERGTWTVRVEGRRLRMGDDVWDEPVSAEKTVVVR